MLRRRPESGDRCPVIGGRARRMRVLRARGSPAGTSAARPKASRRRVRDQRLKVFTTNYDLCFERATSELGGVALDGFSFTAPRRYNPRYFSYDIVRRARIGEDIGHYLEGVYLLYKLHGSVNWERDEEGNVCENESHTPEKACLIYPASGKYQQSFAQPHLESMAQYLSALREPNTCVLVIGFGFNDDHLAEPMLAAAQSSLDELSSLYYASYQLARAGRPHEVIQVVSDTLERAPYFTALFFVERTALRLVAMSEPKQAASLAEWGLTSKRPAYPELSQLGYDKISRLAMRDEPYLVINSLSAEGANQDLSLIHI